MPRASVGRNSGVRRVALATAAALAALTACGSDEAGSTAEGLPQTIKVVITNPTTGVVAHVGDSANKGYQLAVDQINASGLLGDSTIELEMLDTKSEPRTAASHMSQAVADPSVSAVFGSVSSAEAVTQAPLAQNAGLPTVFTQAGSDGVIVGDYTYRATSLMRNYYPTLKTYMEEQGWESVGIVYTDQTPTLADIGGNTLPEMASELGMEVTAKIATTATTQDYSAPIQQVLETDPDVVAILQFAAGNVTAVTQLRQAGYTGPVLSSISAASGVLVPAGAAGVDVVWPSYFSPERGDASTQQFVEDYQAEYGEVPNNYAAEAYDAAHFLARAIEYANSADRAAIKDGMERAAEDTVDGALGSDLVWKDQELQPHGLLIRWDGTKEVLFYDSLNP
jgi:branched-chain amino acid transport system substrate-binding protein